MATSFLVPCVSRGVQGKNLGFLDLILGKITSSPPLSLLSHQHPPPPPPPPRIIMTSRLLSYQARHNLNSILIPLKCLNGPRQITGSFKPFKTCLSIPSEQLDTAILRRIPKLPGNDMFRPGRENGVPCHEINRYWRVIFWDLRTQA